jgi:hypothetical protein
VLEDKRIPTTFFPHHKPHCAGTDSSWCQAQGQYLEIHKNIIFLAVLFCTHVKFGFSFRKKKKLITAENVLIQGADNKRTEISCP